MHDGHIHTYSVEVSDETGLTEQSLKEYLAAKLYGDRKLSLGKAAAMAGIPKWDFPAILARFDVPYFNFPPEELARDIENARPRHR